MILSPTFNAPKFTGIGALLHFHEVPFTDQRGSPVTQTAGATRSTVQSYYAPYSGTVASQSDYILLSRKNKNDIALYSKWSIEGFVYTSGGFTNSPVHLDLAGTNASPGAVAWFLYWDTAGYMHLYNRVTATDYINFQGASTGAFTHFAVCFDGTDLYLGVAPAPSVGSGFIQKYAGVSLTGPDPTGYRLGSRADATNFQNGYMAEFRITPNVALYTGVTGTTYAPPATPFG